jgi:hypothetical protein
MRRPFADLFDGIRRQWAVVKHQSPPAVENTGNAHRIFRVEFFFVSANSGMEM